MKSLTAVRQDSHICRQPAIPSLGLLLPGRPGAKFTRVAVLRRSSKSLGHIVSEAKSAVQLSAVGEVGTQTYSLSLRTADLSTATGLVHRGLVTEAQNSRRVSFLQEVPWLRVNSLHRMKRKSFTFSQS